MIKDKITSFLLAHINVSKVSSFVGKSHILKVPYKFFARKMISYDFPSHIFLETTSACNLKCNFCARTGRDTKIGFMEYTLAKKIIDEANSYGPRTFSLHLFGEPLLSPNFVRIMNYIKESNSRNAILLTTNGTVLTKEKSEAIINAKVDKISISFSSTIKDVYKNITGADQLETVEQNILNLVELKKTKKVTNPPIYVRIIVSETNKEEGKIFEDKWKNKGVNVEVRPLHNYGGYTKIDSKNKQNKKIKRYPCYHLWFSPAIHYNGDVSICCNDWGRVTHLGNAKKQTINEIWNSEKLKKFREHHRKHEYSKVPLCEECDVWSTYEDIF